MKLPYFPFYVGDWLAEPKITALPLEAQGAYIRLLANMWAYGDNCSVPDDAVTIAKMLGVSPQRWQRQIRGLLLRPDGVLKEKDGRLHNARLTAIHEVAVAKSRTRSDAARRRWEKGPANDLRELQTPCNADAKAVQMQCMSDPDPDPDPDPNPNTSHHNANVGAHDPPGGEKAKTWIGWYEATRGVLPPERWRQDIGALAERGMTHEVIIAEIEAATGRVRHPLSAAAQELATMLAAGVRTAADAETYRQRLEEANGHGTRKRSGEPGRPPAAGPRGYTALSQ